MEFYNEITLRTSGSYKISLQTERSIRACKRDITLVGYTVVVIKLSVFFFQTIH
jgi:hypothetical protein